MSGCEQELCGNWAGNAGCPCDVMDLDASERPVVREDRTADPAAVISDDNVIQLRPEGYDGVTCESCDEAWFLATVTIGRDGRVSGWAQTMKCTNCGYVQAIDS